MGQRRLTGPQADDLKKRPHEQKKTSNIAALNATNTRRGEVFRAQRRTSENVNLQASQHLIDIPVNKSIYNGYNGEQFSSKMQPRPQKGDRPKLQIIPIGGVGEMGIGKNMNAIIYDDEIIVIDMGLLFPGADYPGINYLTPDITWLEKNKHKIKAHVFTHGHLDHIGSFRHFIHRIPAPVYASKFTVAMLGRNMDDADTDFEPDYHVMDPLNHEVIQIGKHFSIELARVNHSIPDSTAVIVRTPVGVIIDTGDWRFEDSPVDGQKFDLERLTEISAKEGILMLMSDSTSCESEGTHSHSEFDIQYSIGQVMDKYASSRIILSCFSSQIHRMQLILDEAKKHNRKVAFAGYSMIQNLEVALRTGTIKVPKDTIMKMEDIVKQSDSKVTIVCTGSQGEFSAVLNRMASGSHRHIKIKGSDVVVFSSNPIPGNEKNVVRTVDGLMREGSDVIQNGKSHLTGIGPLHLSGHGYYDDHVKLLNALNPTYYMPIHGEFHMLVHNARLAEKEAGIRKQNIFVCDAGDIIEIDHERQAKKAGRIQVGGVMYDDSGAIVSEVVLKDRIHMSQEGMFVVVLTIQRGTGRLLTSPDIISRGFIYLKDSEELMNLIRQYLRQKMSRGLNGKYDVEVLKKEIREEVTHLLFDQTRRTPIVIPVINEIALKSSANPAQVQSNQRRQPEQPAKPISMSGIPRRKFPTRQVPDSEANDTKARHREDSRAY
ncbi:ribonuclease J [Candidatus Saccharibacteria bacterium]|nr:ribonuclease J [Candidatus Saccharibacteria bacterium]